MKPALADTLIRIRVRGDGPGKPMGPPANMAWALAMLWSVCPQSTDGMEVASPASTQTLMGASVALTRRRDYRALQSF